VELQFLMSEDFRFPKIRVELPKHVGPVSRTIKNNLNDELSLSKSKKKKKKKAYKSSEENIEESSH
jgi:hypothetical protein